MNRLILDKLVFKTKVVTRNKGSFYNDKGINMKGSHSNETYSIPSLPETDSVVELALQSLIPLSN